MLEGTSFDRPANTKESLRQLMDPAPPSPWEERVDMEGNIWVWAPANHTVAQELHVQASGDQYWEERLKLHSRDAQVALDAAAVGDEEKANGSAFGQQAYHWVLKSEVKNVN